MSASLKSPLAVARKGLEAKKLRLLKQIAVVDHDIAELERMEREHDFDGGHLEKSQSSRRAHKKEPEHPAVVGSVGSLIHQYRTDKESPFQKLQFRTKQHYNSCLNRIVVDWGHEKLASLKKPDIEKRHQEWQKRGRSMAHTLITLFRVLVNYGASVLEDNECVRLSVVLRTMQFPYTKTQKTEHLTLEQVTGIIKKAHEMDLPSLALAQAIQYDCQLGQRDVIGEWVPLSEPGTSEIVTAKWKWLRGLRWSDIDENLILRHASSKTEFNLRKAPLVMAEFSLRKTLDKSGPLIVYEKSNVPYQGHQFRHFWRLAADAVGVSKNVKNMESRLEKSRGRAAQDAEAATQ